MLGFSQYAIDDAAHAETIDRARQMVQQLERSGDHGLTAVTWRKGKPVVIDLSGPAPRRTIWPEHVAIAALFIATYAMAINHLDF